MPHANLRAAVRMTSQTSDPTRRPPPALAMILLGASYPLAAHVAALSARPGLIAASIGLLVVLALLPGLRNRRPLAWFALASATAGLFLAARSSGVLLLLFLPPILFNGLVAWVFGRTLRPGAMPLIERLARTLHGPEDPLTEEMIAYARKVTVVWTLLLTALAFVNLALAAFAEPGGLLLAAGFHPVVTVPLSVWSLFANVLNYLLVGAVFLVEYFMRLRRFPQQPHASFVEFLRRVAAQGSLFRPAVGNPGPAGIRNPGD
jgi:uncharacterized membrane protein